LSLRNAPWFVLGLVMLVAIAAVPLFAGGYHLALGINLLCYGVLATAWALFSGPTRYISLATAAFFGVGAYSVAVLADLMPWPAVIACVAGIGGALALIVGLSTLRLSGIYFVVFTFGLAELTRQLVTWYEVNIHRSVGRYIFLGTKQSEIYWQLFALLLVVLAGAWLIQRSRLGLALRVIGEDETVARHSGIATTWAKLIAFALSAAAMTVTGAIMAPRWTYIDPAIAFNSMISFQVVIMALLGGTGRLLGPILGVVPLVLLFEVLTANFPNYFSILLGVVFIVIVYLLPNGVTGLFAAARKTPPPLSPISARENSMRGSMFDLDGLRKSFGGLVAVDDLQFTVRQGEIVGLIGPNGSGKTTVLNLISGALKPDAGTIRFQGGAIEKLAAHRIARLGIARTFQLVRVLPTMSCAENVMTSLAFRARRLAAHEANAEARTLLARVRLGASADVPAGQLTYIDQKRLELARALALEPKLLLLDEWLAGLNPSELGEGIKLIRSLKNEGVSIILVEHVMDAIRSLCDRCIVMNAGFKIAEGPPAAVLSDREVVRAYLGEADA